MGALVIERYYVRTAAAALVAAGVIGGFLIGGLYSAIPGPRGDAVPLAYVVNRFTGNAWYCFPAGCHPIKQLQE